MKTRRTVTLGTGTLKYLIHLLFPGLSRGHDRRLPGPLAITNFRNEISTISCLGWWSLFDAFSHLIGKFCHLPRSRGHPYAPCMSEQDTSTVTVRVKRVIKEQLETLAKRLRRSRSSVAGEAIEVFVAEAQEERIAVHNKSKLIA